MAKTVNDLYEFIDRAVKSRKYPESTAQGLRAALKLFDAELNEEERQSLDLFKNNIEQIYHSVTLKNGKTFSAGSLVAYKSRVMKIINDFERYGVDPTKMASWSPKIIPRGPRKNSSTNKHEQEDSSTSGTIAQPIASVGMAKIELPVRGDKKIIIIVPEDLTAAESNRIKGILDSLTQ